MTYWFEKYTMDVTGPFDAVLPDGESRRDDQRQTSVPRPPHSDRRAKRRSNSRFNARAFAIEAGLIID